MKKSPLAQVKDRFGSKDKLVEAVKKLATDELWLDRLNEDGGFELVPNRKLLHLHDVLKQVKDEFGSREKLIDGILAAEGRPKDEGYRTRLEAYPTPRLWDAYGAAKRRATRRAAASGAAAAS